MLREPKFKTRMTDDQEVIAAGALHDSAETSVTLLEEIRSQFGPRVAELAAAGTEDRRGFDPTPETWEFRKRALIDRLNRETRPEVKMIALADKLSNLAAMKGDYAQVGEALWTRFNQQDPARQAWFYRSMGETTRSLSRFQAWQAYEHLVGDVFSRWP